MSRALLSLFFFCLVLGVDEGWAVETAQGVKGKIERENYVNFRSGPGLSHPPITVLRRGEEVVVEEREGSWYRVSLSDGREGYVYWEYVEVAGTVKPKPGTSKKPAPIAAPKAPPEPVAETPPEAEEHLPASLKPPPAQPERAAPGGALLPLNEILEERGWDMLVWVVGAICIFILGWICGGNYYLRRDRIRRTKIHF